ILNDSATRLWRQTAEWFAAAGEQPRPRIELNDNDAVKGLVAAGSGAAALPPGASARAPAPRIPPRPLRPPLWPAPGHAPRPGEGDGATQRVRATLRQT